MKRKVLAVYSATGNTRYISSFFEGYDIMDMTTAEELPEDTDVLGLAFPVYFGGVPYPVEKFIMNVIAPRDNREIGYIFGVLTSGGAKGFAYSHLSQLLADAGCALSYVNSVTMPDAYLPMKPVAVTNEERDEIVKKAEADIQKILEDVKEEKFELAKVGLLYRLFRKQGRSARLPQKNGDLTVTELCTSCGRCIEVCPMKNIKMENGRPILGNECISCFACYHMCPENALAFPKAEGQYVPLGDRK